MNTTDIDFSGIQKGTECPFSHHSDMKMSPFWTPSASFSENLQKIYLDIKEFIDTNGPDRFDGYVVKLPGTFGECINTLSKSVNTVLRFLSRRFDDDCFLENVESENWRFRLGRRVFFVLAFAPFYSDEHSRFAFDSDFTFIVLQPDEAFTRRVRQGSVVIHDTVRDNIRVAYAVAGRIYDLALSCSQMEAYKFVKPVALHSPPVRWWEAGLIDDGSVRANAPIVRG